MREEACDDWEMFGIDLAVSPAQGQSRVDRGQLCGERRRAQEVTVGEREGDRENAGVLGNGSKTLYSRVYLLDFVGLGVMDLDAQVTWNQFLNRHR